MKTRFLALPAVALALACGLAQAQSFRCGGVGQAEQEQFKGEAARHSALLTFAVSTGAYVGDVDFSVTDSQGKVVLQGRCGGPLMLLDLPARGSYQVSASYEGKAQRKAIVVGSKPARPVFTWKAG